MNTTHDNSKQLAARRQALKAALSELGDLRPGQLTQCSQLKRNTLENACLLMR